MQPSIVSQAQADPLGPVSASSADSAATVIVYQSIRANNQISSHISLAQFESHLRYIERNNYMVLPLATILKKLRNGDTLGEHTIAITFDQATSSVYELAWPRLKAANLPFTLFVSTAPLDENAPGYMSWAELQTLAQDTLVTIGSQAAIDSELVSISPSLRAERIDRASQRLTEKLGLTPTLFAYPDGAMSADLVALLKQRGFTAAFGHHSGPISVFEDNLMLPRFPLNARFGDVDRLRMISKTLPFPVHDRTPPDLMLPAQAKAGVNPPAFGFSFVDKNFEATGLACYASDIDHALELWRPAPERVEVIFKRPFKRGATRINCTMPATDKGWRWLGTLFFATDPHDTSGADQTARTSSTSGM